MEFSELNALAEKYKTQTLINERKELYQAILFSPKGDVVEVGSASGGTTVVLLGAAEKVDKKVISIDPYSEELEGRASHYTKGVTKKLKEEFDKNILSNVYWGNRIKQIQKTTRECINEIPNNLSVVFIDGCREYEQAKEEYDLLFPKVIKGGYIAIHDINWQTGQISNTTKGAVENMVSEFDDSKKYSLVSIIDHNMIIGKKK